ncbi:toxin [Bordetella petrii]|uniref:toxin n=1 Tax=Bordetella petrii TaxID=94624 RepID=UPI001E328CDE|nr:toxin [Bordetella petrii]MCD0504834.1 toxin [Bordetella petrii]
MEALFIELPPFERHRRHYLTDDAFEELQASLMRHPEAGKLIPGTEGLRKLRFADCRRQKGKRGGIRVIYFWWSSHSQFWLFTLYGKDLQDDLTAAQRVLLSQMLNNEPHAGVPS